MRVNERHAISTAVAAIIVVIILIAAIAAIYFYTLPTGGTTTSSSSTSQSLPPATINLITFTDPSNVWLSWAAQKFTAIHPGVTVNIINQSFSQYATTEKTALKTGSNTYDIITFTSTSALGFLPYVVPLDNVVSINSSDIPAAQMAFGGIYRNATTGTTEEIGAVYDSSTFAFFYRTDIYNNPQLNSTFYSQYHVSLNPNSWTSWNDVLDADYFLVNQTHTVQYGMVTDADQSHDIIDTFPAIYGAYYAADSSVNGGNPHGGLTNWNIMFQGSAPAGKSPPPSFNSSSGVAALQTFYKLVKYDPQPFTGVNYGTVFQPLAAGTASGALMFTADATSLLSSKEAGNIGVALLPGGYAETGTDFYAVSKYSSHQQDAEAFIQYLLSPQINAGIYYKAGEFPISKQAVHLISENSSVPQWQRNLVSGVFATAASGWANPPNQTYTSTSLIPAFNQPIFNFLTSSDGSSTAAMQALNTAAAAWVQAVAQNS
jgi:multiple sugar transport system substrate-binding protein